MSIRYEKLDTAEPGSSASDAPLLQHSPNLQVGGSHFKHAFGSFSRRQVIITIGAAILALPLLGFLFSGSSSYNVLTRSKSLSIQEMYDILAAKHPLKKEDIAILMKSGSNVLEDRLAAHMDCEFNDTAPSTHWPTFQVYSDYDQVYRGHAVVDAIKTVPREWMFPEVWDLYNRQKEQLDQGISPKDIKIDRSTIWALDKYKFIPMLQDAYDRFPNAKYFVCLEADTWMFLGSLVRWLQNQDHLGQAFFGSPVENEFEHFWFAHGGSGYILSKGLMDATFGKDRNHMMNAFGNRLPGICCGEEWLARSMYSLPNVMVKAPYGGSTEYFSGETPLSQRFDASNWCEPIMSFHHLDDYMVRRIFNFERTFFPRLLPTDHIRHIDIFEEFAPDFLLDSYESGKDQVIEHQWENRCETEVEPQEGQHVDQNFCEEACEARGDCLQWQFYNGTDSKPSRCEVYNQLRIGSGEAGGIHTKSDFTSGWRLDRFKAMRAQQWCEDRPMLG